MLKQNFLKLFNKENIQKDSVFMEMVIKGQEILELTDSQISKKMMITKPTYERWKKGANFPHKYMRPGILEFFLKEMVNEQY